MAPRAKHKEAIVETAATLFRRHGYAATGINDIVETSGAPKGSLYHYFPDGKDAIGAAALRFAGGRVTATLEHLAAQHRHADAIVKAYGALLAGWMTKSNFRDGCPITTTVLETTPGSATISETGQDVFAQWIGVLARALMGDGLPERRATTLARFAISALEGALILARVERSAQPIEEAAQEAARLFRRERMI